MEHHDLYGEVHIVESYHVTVSWCLCGSVRARTKSVVTRSVTEMQVYLSAEWKRAAPWNKYWFSKVYATQDKKAWNQLLYNSITATEINWQKLIFYKYLISVIHSSLTLISLVRNYEICHMSFAVDELDLCACRTHVTVLLLGENADRYKWRSTVLLFIFTTSFAQRYSNTIYSYISTLDSHREIINLGRVMPLHAGTGDPLNFVKTYFIYYYELIPQLDSIAYRELKETSTSLERYSFLQRTPDGIEINWKHFHCCKLTFIKHVCKVAVDSCMLIVWITWID